MIITCQFNILVYFMYDAYIYLSVSETIFTYISSLSEVVRFLNCLPSGITLYCPAIIIYISNLSLATFCISLYVTSLWQPRLFSLRLSAKKISYNLEDRCFKAMLQKNYPSVGTVKTYPEHKNLLHLPHTCCCTEGTPGFHMLSLTDFSQDASQGQV